MIAVLFILITLVVELFAGNAAAGGETVMAMQGNPPDGVTPVNAFTALTGAGRGGVGERPAQVPAEVLAAPGVEEPGGVSGRDKARLEAILQWQDHCVRTPRLVAGQALPMESSAGFGLAPMFVERRTDGATELLKLIIRELY